MATNASFTVSSQSPPMTTPALGADNYVIGEEIAQGGMGSILEAVDTKLQRTVAAKVMSLDADTNPIIRERFLREAKVLATLEHPNIVPIHDVVWEADAPLFYTMKLVRGRNLQAVLDDLRAGQPDVVREHTLDRLLTTFRKICDAVAFAHSKGVLHRDLKPANVMVGEFGEVLVMDWGLAKIVDSKELMVNGQEPQGLEPSTINSQLSSTLQGTVIGTPYYMPPEQAQGGITELDERSDVYSLGAILYAILTLRRPVDGRTTNEVLQKVINGQLTSPVELQADASFKPLPHIRGGRAPAALSAVAMRALSHEPGRRYPRVLSLSAEVEAYQAGRATQAENAGTLRQLWLLMKRNRTGTAALAALLLLGFAFVLEVMAGERAARSAEANAVRERDTTRQALARANISLAEAACYDQDSKSMLALLDSVPQDLRNTDWGYLRTQADTAHQTLDFRPEASAGIVGRPGHPGVFAVCVGSQKVLLFDARHNRVLKEFPLTRKQQRTLRPIAVAFSPHGSRLAVASQAGGSMAVYKADTGEVLGEWDIDGAQMLHFSPDGKRLLDVDDGILSLRDAATGKVSWASTERYHSAQFLPDGGVIACRLGGVHVLDITTGAEVRDLPPVPSEIMNMVLTRDGNTVLLACWDGRVRGQRTGDGSLIFDQPLTDGRGTAGRVAASPDCKLVVGAVSLADDIRLMRVWDIASGRMLKHLMGGTTRIEGLAVHPISGEIVTSGRQLKAWLPVDATPPKWEATGGSTDAAVFWDAEDSFLVRLVPLLLKPNGKLAWADIAAALRPEDRSSPTVAASGPWLAAGGGRPDYSVILYQKSASGLALSSILKHGHGQMVRMIFSPGARHLAMANRRRLVQVLEPATGKVVARCDIGTLSLFTDICWAGPDRLVGLGHGQERGMDEQVVLWDAMTGRILHQISHPTAMQCLAAAPDGLTFAEGGTDKRIRIRDSRTLQVLHEFRAHDKAISALAFHPTRAVLASTSSDSTVRLWSLPDATLLKDFRPSSREPKKLAFSPSGARLAVCDTGGVARIWDLDLDLDLK